MEIMVISVPDKKKALVKQLLKELGVTIEHQTAARRTKKSKVLKALTAKVLDDAPVAAGLN